MRYINALVNEILKLSMMSLYKFSVQGVVVMENREYTKRKKEADEIFCSECGEIIKQKAEICPMCGVRQHGTPPNDEKSLASKFWTTASVSF